MVPATPSGKIHFFEANQRETSGKFGQLEKLSH
jgi:hypothetical protein